MAALGFHKIFPPFFSEEDCVFLKAEGWIGPWQDPYLYLKGRALCMDAHLLGRSANISSLTGRDSKQEGQEKHSILYCK